MQLARVVGHAVSTVKHPSFQGWRSSLVQPLTADGKEDGEPLLVIDPVGAGAGSLVILSNDGAGARQLIGAEKLTGSLVRDGDPGLMATNGQAQTAWGYAVEGKPSAMLQAALLAHRRNGSHPQSLPACNGEACGWARQLAECLARGTCQAAVIFCDDPGMACCVANKVPGVRAVAIWTISQARQAISRLGANLLVVEMAGRTYFECKELLRLCEGCVTVTCPDGVACVLKELDGHAHR